MPQVTKLMSVRTISTAPVPTSSEQTLNFGRSRKCADYFLNCKSRRTSLNCIGDKCFRIIHFFFQMKSGHWVTLCDRLKPTSSDCKCNCKCHTWHWSDQLISWFSSVFSLQHARSQTNLHACLFIHFYLRPLVSVKEEFCSSRHPSVCSFHVHSSVDPCLFPINWWNDIPSPIVTSVVKGLQDMLQGHCGWWPGAPYTNTD